MAKFGRFAACLVVSSGCQVDLEPDPGARIACTEASHCPAGFICNDLLGLCVAVDNLDQGSPGIGAGATITPPVAGPNATVTVTFGTTEPVLRVPGVTLDIPGDPLLALADDTGDSWTFTYVVNGSEPQGPANVLADLVDTSGNSATDVPVGSVTFDFSAPVVSAVGAVGNPRLSRTASGTVQFTISESVSADPTLHITETGAALTLLTHDAMTATYQFEYEVVAADTDGPHGVTIEVSDDAGNTSIHRAGGVFEFDFVGPQLAAGSGGVVLLPSATNVLPAINTITDGTTVRVEFGVDEALQADPAVATTSPAPLVLTKLSNVGQQYVYEHTLVGLLHPQGAYTVEVMATDLAGNTSMLPLPLAMPGFVVDTQPPTAPDTQTAGVIVYRRFPWGSDGTGGAPTFTVAGAAGAVEPGGIVRATSSSGLFLGQNPIAAAADGSFSAFSLAPTDFPFVEVEVADGAGNVSPAAEVMEVEWTATIGSKIVGDIFSNPHRYFTVTAAAPQLVHSVAHGSVDRGGSEGVELRDAVPLSVTSVPRWVDEGSGRAPLPATIHAMAYNAARAEIVLQGGVSGASFFGATWVNREGGWRTLGNVGPGVRYGATMSYDARRDEMVLFGGSGVSTVGRTWLFDGFTWRIGADVGAGPQLRYLAAMAYDTRRARTILFGGDDPSFGGSADCGEGAGTQCAYTWEWDGQGWTLAATTGPPPRINGGMAYDPLRGEVVLYGGQGCGGVCNDTWLWDGSTWTPAAAGPGSRQHHAMAFSPADGTVLMFGGLNAPAGCNEGAGDECVYTWEWDGAGWSNVTMTGPGPRSGARMAQDGTGGLLLVGEADASCASGCGSVWRWDRGWQEISETVPEARRGPGAVYHPGRRSVLVFGGDALDGDCNEGDGVWCGYTWRWDGHSWETDQTAGGPVGRASPAMFYRPGAGAILFGGDRLGDACEADMTFGMCTYTWRKAGGNWSLRTTMGPIGRISPVMSRDSTDLFLFGGQALPGGYQNDSWRFTGTWGVLSPAGSVPAARTRHAMAQDRNGDVVLYGGLDGSTTRGDTWIWNGTSWSSPGATGPGPRAYHAMGYDERELRTVLFGGRNAMGIPVTETWEWDGTGWSLLTDIAPQELLNLAITWDNSRKRLVLVAGTAGDLLPVWSLDRGATSRPAHIFAVDFASAGEVVQPTVHEVLGRWDTGGMADGGSRAGVEVRVWDEGRWLALATNPSASPSNLGSLNVSVTDAAMLRRLFVGQRRELVFAATPLFDNGTAPGRIDVDYVEVTVRYRRP